MPDRSTKAVIAVTLLALLLVAAVPVALLAAVVMMMLGHLVGGLALFGGSILAAAIAVALAGASGIRHLRKLLSGRSFGVRAIGRQPVHRPCRVAEQRLHRRRAARPQRVHRSPLTCPPCRCAHSGPDIRQRIQLIARNARYAAREGPAVSWLI